MTRGAGFLLLLWKAKIFCPEGFSTQIQLIHKCFCLVLVLPNSGEFGLVKFFNTFFQTTD